LEVKKFGSLEVDPPSAFGTFPLTKGKASCGGEKVEKFFK
jgi:hypothetical protein